MREELEREEVVAAVDRMVDELLQKAEVVRPPVDAVLLARRHLGMQVCLDERQRNAAGRNVRRDDPRSSFGPSQRKSAISGPWPTKSASISRQG